MAAIQSMTGFGKAVSQLPGKKITIEVKSLNSKQLDMNLRMPQLFREKESEIREVVARNCGRGKIDFNLYCEITGPELAPKVNTVLVSEYIRQLKTVMQENEVSGDILAAVMRLPDVTISAEDEVDEKEWQGIQEVINEALDKLSEFRHSEGAKLQQDLEQRLHSIEQKMQAITPLEAERTSRIKEKIQRGLQELKEKIDENRFEQEFIYYLEKLDVTEEKVRLRSHIEYFRQLLNEGGLSGKKLGFIAQEMGREINTLGSKANYAEIQRLVVEMKDELEKIKEQVLNIL
jgi:uncharacterized protein (TIGR00255 family)